MTRRKSLQQTLTRSKQPNNLTSEDYTRENITPLLTAAYKKDITELFCHSEITYPKGEAPSQTEPSVGYSCDIHKVDHVLTRTFYDQNTYRRDVISNIQRMANKIGATPNLFLKVDAELFDKHLFGISRKRTPMPNSLNQDLPAFLVTGTATKLKHLDGKYFYALYQKLIQQELDVFCEKGKTFDPEYAPKELPGYVYYFCKRHNKVHLLEKSIHGNSKFSKITQSKLKEALHRYKDLPVGHINRFVDMSNAARLDLLERHYNMTPKDPQQAAKLRFKRENVLGLLLTPYPSESVSEAPTQILPKVSSAEYYPVNEKLAKKLPKKIPGLTIKSLTRFFTQISKVDSKMFCDYGTHFPYKQRPTHLQNVLALHCTKCNKTHILHQDAYLASSQLMAYRQLVIKAYKTIPTSDRIIQFVAYEVSHNHFEPLTGAKAGSKTSAARRRFLNNFSESKTEAELKKKVKELKLQKEFNKTKIQEHIIRKSSYLHIDASEVSQDVLFMFQQCLRKASYTDIENANLMLAQNHPNTDKHPYECPHCGNYHLGATSPDLTFEQKLETAMRNWNDDRYAFAVHKTIVSLGLMKENNGHSS